MSESRPEESPQNEQGDAQTPAEAPTEPAEANDTAPDTSDPGTTGETQASSNVVRPKIVTSPAKEGMAEQGSSTTTETAANKTESTKAEDKPTPTQEEEFVVVQLSDGQQSEAQGTG